MRERTKYESDQKITVDIIGLQAMLSVGRNTAIRIGEEAGAVVKIGNRKLYSVKKVQQYIDNIGA